MPALTLIIVCSCWLIVRSFPSSGAKCLHLNAPQYVGPSKRRDASCGQWSPAVVDRRSISPPEKRGL